MMTQIQELYRNQFTRFVLVGMLNTAVGYGVFAGCFFLDFSYPVSLTISSVIGTLHSYFWNKYFTFRITVKSFSEFLRFVSVYAVIYLINLLLLYVLVDLLIWHELAAQAIILLVVTVSSFMGHKYWSFKK